MIKVKFLAYENAPESLFRQGKKKFTELFPDEDFEFYAPVPDIIVFLSGGSEKKALEVIRPGNFYLLTAFEENNSYAAAAEVKAHLDQSGIHAMLTDLHEDHDRKIIKRYFMAINAYRKLEGTKLGLIGEVSPWLISSTIPTNQLKNRFGIQLQEIPWSAVPAWEEQPIDEAFSGKFGCKKVPAVKDAGRVHQALKAVVNENKLDAFTIECFSLVNEKGVTACLSLAEFNDSGIPAGCEGDICSITGMMMLRALLGKVPWMANLIKVSIDCVRFAHCTAPTNLLDAFEVDTHYETGMGTAVAGKFGAQQVTVFRMDNELTKAFVSEGRVISTHKTDYACRTQIEVGLPEKDAKLLKHHPLGNHHLIIPGYHRSVIKMMCKVCGLKVVN
jgi:L-fucose isomerase-like protein